MSRGDAVLRDLDAVRRHADVADPAARLGLERARVGAVRVLRVGDRRGLVELEEIDVVGLHHLQAVFDVCQDPGLVPGGTLGGDHDLIAHVRERKTDLLFAVGIGVCRVKIADAAVIGCLQELDRVLLVAALHGQTSHSGLGNNQAGFSQYHCFHAFSSLVFSVSGRPLFILA